MTEAEPKRFETSEEMKRFYERLCQRPPGTCVGVYDFVPIFEVEDLAAIRSVAGSAV